MDRGQKRTAEWWLPGMSPIDSVPGTYEVTDNGQVEVELHRALPNQNRFDFFAGESIEYPIIHGLAFGLPVTLVKARTVGGRANLSSLHVNTHLRPWISLEGLLLSDEETRLDDVSVRVEHQDVWDNHDSFHATLLKSTGFPATINYSPLKTDTARISNGAISVRDASAYHPKESNITLKSRSNFSLKFDKPVPLEDLARRHIRSLLLMMTVATGRDCGVLDVQGTSSDWVVENERNRGDRWLTVRIGKSSGDTKSLTAHELLFNLDDLDWQAQAPHFFDITDEWAYPIELWASLASSKLFWPLSRFANSVQAVEALDRILHPSPAFTPDTATAEKVNETLVAAGFNSRVRSKVKDALLRPREASLESRISRLSQRVNVAMDALWDSEIPWEGRIARLRHVASHGLEDAERFISDTRAIEVATEILLHLLECLFLERVGFDANKIAELQERRRSFGYRRRLINEHLPLLDSFPASRTSKT